MLIQHLNTYNTGGAARAALRLHLGLLRQDIDSRFAVKTKNFEDSSVLEVPFVDSRNPLIKKITRQFGRTKRISTQSPYNNGRSHYSFKSFRQLSTPDIYHFHWLAKLVDWSLLPKFAKSAPIIWTLHDMQPFSGIWHYQPYETEVTTELERLDAKTLKFKLKVIQSIAEDRVIIVSPSKWLYEESSQSEVFSKFRHFRIPYGLDTDVFRPHDKLVVRRKHNLPLDLPIVGVMADRLEDPRKGLKLFSEAINRCKTQNLGILTIGENLEQWRLSKNHYDLGYINEDHNLAEVYSACDLMVVPSLQDNLPNAVLEAMACSTPVLGFDVGGIPDMVRPGENGWLVPHSNIEALANAMDHVFAEDQLIEKFGQNARKIILQDYSLERQATQYIDLYRQILNVN